MHKIKRNVIVMSVIFFIELGQTVFCCFLQVGRQISIFTVHEGLVTNGVSVGAIFPRKL